MPATNEIPVRLTITRINTSNLIAGSAELLLDTTVTAAQLPEAASAWIIEHGYDTGTLPQAAVNLLRQPVPEDGFLALINKPTELLFYATWPWAKPNSFEVTSARH